MATKSAPRKAAARKSAPRKTVARKSSPAKSAAVTARRRTKPEMSAQHKQALALGREEGRAVRQYLEALEAHKPKRGRKRTAAGIENRLKEIDSRLGSADPLARVHLVQEQFDLQSELEVRDDTVDLKALEDAFVRSAHDYSQRKGLTYAAWRAVGVNANVLRRAGIPRTRG
jgi:hypothetical protein